MDTRDETGPVFVVGPSRAGTTLLRAILNGLPGVWITNETHYFDDLRPRLRAARSGRARGQIMAECRDLFQRLGSAHYEEIVGSGGAAAAARDTMSPAEALVAADEHFVAFCRGSAAAMGASVWGEKTPRHVFRIDEILAAFPKARVICLVRDPRAVVASYRDWSAAIAREATTDEAGTSTLDRSREQFRRAQSYHILIAAMLWRAAVKASQRAEAAHGAGAVRIVHFEDIVRTSEPALREMSAWLGVPYEPHCLNVPMQNSSTQRYDRTGGIQAGPTVSWRQTLSANEIALIEWVTRDGMANLGYTPTGPTLPLAVKARAVASLPWAVLRAGLANRRRSGGLARFVVRRLRSF